jgi:hypothetical protein
LGDVQEFFTDKAAAAGGFLRPLVFGLPIVDPYHMAAESRYCKKPNVFGVCVACVASPDYRRFALPIRL